MSIRLRSVRARCVLWETNGLSLSIFSASERFAYDEKIHGSVCGI